jgi:hypothetical protein
MTEASRDGNREQSNLEGNNNKAAFSRINELSNAISPRPNQAETVESEVRRIFTSNNTIRTTGGERSTNSNRPPVSSSVNEQAISRYRPYSSGNIFALCS